jgi:SulP family sulfate permease
MKIVRINGSIFFGAVAHLQEQLQQIDDRNPAHKHLLLVASGINFVDLAGARLLAHEARRRRSLGGDLFLYHVKDEPLEMMRRSGVFDEIGAANFFQPGDDVPRQLVPRLQRHICESCQVRIFAPCGSIPIHAQKE